MPSFSGDKLLCTANLYSARPRSGRTSKGKERRELKRRLPTRASVRKMHWCKQLEMDEQAYETQSTVNVPAVLVDISSLRLVADTME